MVKFECLKIQKRELTITIRSGRVETHVKQTLFNGGLYRNCLNPAHDDIGENEGIKSATPWRGKMRI